MANYRGVSGSIRNTTDFSLSKSEASPATAVAREGGMSKQPRFEELDEDADDPEEVDISDVGASSSSMLSQNDLPQPSSGGMPQSADATFKKPTSVISREELEKFKDWPCVYPIYFDASRSIQDGRRVPQKLAVPNPMAKELAEAAASLGIQSIFEPGKTHPKDWANPGRIRIAFKTEAERSKFKTKRALYAAMAAYLQAHPIDANSPMKVQLPGMPMDKLPPPPAVPKGWKLNEILPVYSPALSGGGVSDNLMRDLLREEGLADPTAQKKKGKRR